MGKLKVWSEVGCLRKVLLHRPGLELNSLIPAFLEDLLFDEIPWLAKAQNEHDQFASVLKKLGVEVYYLEQLLIDIIQDEKIKEELVNRQMHISNLANHPLSEAAFHYLVSQKPQNLIPTLISGLSKQEIQHFKNHKTLSDLTLESFPFYLPPLPNMYFTRDNAAMIGDRLQLSNMFLPARKMETTFYRLIKKYHSLFKDCDLTVDENIPYNIEGGDVFVLNQETLIIGLSERTSEEAIEWVANKYIVENKLIKHIIVIQIPRKRSYMHLDTVLTMVDLDKFLFFSGIKDMISVFWLERGFNNVISASNGYSLKGALCKALNLKNIDIIHSGGDDDITAAREQWGDSTNILAVMPGKVIGYDRNEVTNETLRKHGVDIIEIESSELVRGRGGPRCMSMPLDRSDL